MHNASKSYDRRRLALTLGLVALLTLPAAVGAQADQIPLDWHANVAVPGEYVVRGDVARRPGGSGFTAGTIITTTAEPTEGALMQQSVRADEYRGQRVRLTGYLKTSIAPAAAVSGLFIRADADAGPLASNFMMSPAVSSTKDWEMYAIVVDVPRNAAGITFGFYLTGVGQAWLDDMTLEAVGREVALDCADSNIVRENGIAPQRHSFREKYGNAPLHPVNLNFEDVGSVAIRQR